MSAAAAAAGRWQGGGWRRCMGHRCGGKDAASGEADAARAEVHSLKLQVKLQKGVCSLAVAIKVTGAHSSEIY